MTSGVPSFDPSEVALLASSVQQTLEHLRQANERVGGSDPELLEYGRRYAVVLQKLQISAGQTPVGQGHT